MAGTSGTIIDLAEALFRAGARWPMVAENIAVRAVEIGRVAAVGAIQAVDLIFRGKLLHSIAGKVVAEGTDAERRIIGNVYSTAGSEAIVMDLGRKPGATWPNVRQLRGWIVGNIGSFSLFLTKRGKAKKIRVGAKNAAERAATGSAAEREVTSIVFVVGRHIKEVGIKAAHFMARAREAINASLKQIAAETVETFLGETF